MRDPIDSLRRTHEMIRAAVAGLSEDQVKWKPDDGAWSILEIINHLADEESEDFRKRLRLVLEDPELEWPGIDPEGAAIKRKYNEQPWPVSLERFISARKASLKWLDGLGPDAVDWSRAKTHSRAGTLHAGDLLLSWAAHDLLHLRQITKRRVQLLQQAGQPYSTEYAGSW